MFLILSELYFCEDGKADEVEENDENDDSKLYNLITNIHRINPSGNNLLCDSSSCLFLRYLFLLNLLLPCLCVMMVFVPPLFDS